MSDVASSVSRVFTTDGSKDPYDHEISLADNTGPEVARTRTESSRVDRRGITRNLTQTSVREQLARRKYRKWQEERFSKTDIGAEDGENDGQDSTSAPAAQDETEAQDFAEPSKSKKPKKHKPPPSEVDVLYENQRGSFFFGIPLYSHSSLLNFDPSPWVNQNFRDSPVNITNAQLPDPSWEWAWKKWYVDMTGDVDEEGWQYSFAFGNKFSWHGSHPWLHSFVRRRRWLRKRIKRHHLNGSITKDSMSAAHKLTAEYFTIHPARDRSPDSYKPASVISERSVEVDEAPEDIKDIASLLKALRLATIDREKLEAVKKFVRQGGEELSYLGSSIPEIMSRLVFQNSRMQLLSFLKTTANEAQEHRDQHEAEDRPEGEVEKQRIDNLLAAVDAADREILGLEYWSDRKHILKTADADAHEMRAISTIFDAPAPEPKPDKKPAAGIKGIASEAEVDVDHTHRLMHQAYQSRKGEGEGEREGKGKERAKEEEKRPDPPPRLGTDQVFIPD